MNILENKTAQLKFKENKAECEFQPSAPLFYTRDVHLTHLY